MDDEWPDDEWYSRAEGDEVDEVVGALLTASRLLVAVAARSLAAVEESLTLPRFRMLVVLDTRGRISISRLAGLLSVNPSTAMRMVDRLVVAGLVERAENPGNRREILTWCTPEGAAVVRSVTERRRAEIARVVAAMPPARRRGLVVALRAFTDAGGEPAATGIPTLPGWR